MSGAEVLMPLVGSAMGGLMSGGGSTGPASAPWEGVQGPLKDLYRGAIEQYNTAGPGYYPGSTVAPLSPATQDAQQGIYSLATNKSPVLQRGQQSTYNTLGGEYLYGNPAMQDLYNMGRQDFMQSTPAMWDLYDTTADNFFSSNPGARGLASTAQGDMLNANPHLDSMFDQASSAVGRQFRNNVMPGITSAFSGAGRFGSNQMAEGLGQAEEEYGDTLSDLATRIYGGNYANERGMQQQAQTGLGSFGLQAQQQRASTLGDIGRLGLAARGQQAGNLGMVGDMFGGERERMMKAGLLAPGLDQADYYGMDRLMGVGGQQDAYNQTTINADRERYDYLQGGPQRQLQFLNSLLQNSPMQSTGGYQSGNPLMGMMGGYNMASSIFGGNPQYQGWTGTSLAPFFYGNGTSGG